MKKEENNFNIKTPFCDAMNSFMDEFKILKNNSDQINKPIPIPNTANNNSNTNINNTNNNNNNNINNNNNANNRLVYNN